MILQERPPKIEAVKFEGGLDSAREVLEFAYVRGLADGAYVPEMLDDGVVVKIEMVVAASDGYVRGKYQVYKDCWLVFHPGDGIYTMTEEALRRQYVPVETNPN